MTRIVSKWTLVAVLATLPLATAAVAAAENADVSGTWEMTLLDDSIFGSKSVQLAFEVDDHSLVATVTGGSSPVECIGYLDGEDLRFYYVKPGRRGTLVVFSGHVRGDLMGGEVDLGKKGPTTWKAVRGSEGEVDLSGPWTLVVRGGSPSGLGQIGIEFRQEGHHIVITMHGEREDVECPGYIDGRLIVFYYVRPTAEGQFVAKFTGQIAGALIGGDVDMGDMGKTTWRATKNV